MLELLKCDTFWSAVSALATIVGAAAIVFATKQLRFDAWLKAQEVWVSKEFTADRAQVFARLDNLKEPWTPEQKLVALNVYRRVDEFVRLAPYLGNRRMLAVWGDPLAKAWLVLEPAVREERTKTGWTTKWDAFQKIGTKALSTRPGLQAKQQRAADASSQAMNPSGNGCGDP